MNSMLAILIGSVVIAIVALVILSFIILGKFVDYFIGIDDDFDNSAKTKLRAQ